METDLLSSALDYHSWKQDSSDIRIEIDRINMTPNENIIQPGRRLHRCTCFFSVVELLTGKRKPGVRFPVCALMFASSNIVYSHCVPRTIEGDWRSGSKRDTVRESLTRVD